MIFDITLLLLIPGFLIGLYAQAKLSSTYRVYLKIINIHGYSGYQVARKMLDENGLYDIKLIKIQGYLSDHYDPRTKEVRLSSDIYNGTSIASVGIAAHEVGHAIQDAQGYFPLRIRNIVIPITNFSNYLYFPLILLGIILGHPTLIQYGILLFSIIVFFQLITLPVEFNASSHAIDTLNKYDILIDRELVGAKKVLSAAALTYVAAAVTAILQLLRLLLLFGSSNNE